MGILGREMEEREKKEKKGKKKKTVTQLICGLDCFKNKSGSIYVYGYMGLGIVHEWHHIGEGFIL